MKSRTGNDSPVASDRDLEKGLQGSAGGLEMEVHPSAEDFEKPHQDSTEARLEVLLEAKTQPAAKIRSRFTRPAAKQSARSILIVTSRLERHMRSRSSPSPIPSSPIASLNRNMSSSSQVRTATKERCGSKPGNDGCGMPSAMSRPRLKFSGQHQKPSPRRVTNRRSLSLRWIDGEACQP